MGKNSKASSTNHRKDFKAYIDAIVDISDKIVQVSFDEDISKEEKDNTLKALLVEIKKMSADFDNKYDDFKRKKG